jgi:hypothetical protein
MEAKCESKKSLGASKGAMSAGMNTGAWAIFAAGFCQTSAARRRSVSLGSTNVLGLG